VRPEVEWRALHPPRLRASHAIPTPSSFGYAWGKRPDMTDRSGAAAQMRALPRTSVAISRGWSARSSSVWVETNDVRERDASLVMTKFRDPSRYSFRVACAATSTIHRNVTTSCTALVLFDSPHDRSSTRRGCNRDPRPLRHRGPPLNIASCGPEAHPAPLDRNGEGRCSALMLTASVYTP
jgi:hypothetical protein